MTLLPPQEFTWTRYLSVILSWESIQDTKNYIAALMKLNIIGYCHADDVDTRHRSNDYAVMFEQDNCQSWCHIPKDVFDEYLEALK